MALSINGAEPKRSTRPRTRLRTCLWGGAQAARTAKTVLTVFVLLKGLVLFFDMNNKPSRDRVKNKARDGVNGPLLAVVGNITRLV